MKNVQAKTGRGGGVAAEATYHSLPSFGASNLPLFTCVEGFFWVKINKTGILIKQVEIKHFIVNK